ncbi:MAG: site-specific tyrosine recombinase XerD [Bacteroidales bacterium]|nr:site-specific tyrosine recombinase XerD [Bacteroidales bacterium]
MKTRRPDDVWQEALAGFRSYLKLEKSLSSNTLAAYSRDVSGLFDFLREKGVPTPLDAQTSDLEAFVAARVSEDKLAKRSQARLLSSIKSFYGFLDQEGRLAENPSDSLAAPHLNPHLPSVLTYDEVKKILESVDLSKPGGHRDRAMLEVLYSCGLRVSELVNLHISDLFLKEGYVRIIGKGNKQRLVPIGEIAADQIGYWMDERRGWPIKKDAEDILFINRHGGKLSRVAVFNLVRDRAVAVGITKEISPHTFRHSFATHLVENGADLRVVQEMLGHESILTTEIYTHIDTRKWQETILRYHPKSE